MPVHVHADEEELFFVLDGAGLSWQDGRAYAVRAGDASCTAPAPRPHTIVGAGDGLVVLAFGGGSDTDLTWLPRAQARWDGPHWMPHDGPNPFDAEEAAGPLDVPEPEARAPADDRRARRRRAEDFTGRRRRGRRAPRLRRRARVDAHGRGPPRRGAGRLSGPPHCHAAEEEIFFVLDGDGTLLLGDEEHPVRAGSVVARPPGTGVAHAFRAGDGR